MGTAMGTGLGRVQGTVVQRDTAPTPRTRTRVAARSGQGITAALRRSHLLATVHRMVVLGVTVTTVWKAMGQQRTFIRRGGQLSSGAVAR